jgi:phosphoribosylformylglycinamidine synthase
MPAIGAALRPPRLAPRPHPCYPAAVERPSRILVRGAIFVSANHRFRERFEDVLPMKARVTVTLKTGVLDPQGKAIQGALKSLGFANVDDVRQGKLIEFEIAETDRAKAEAAVADMCEQLLANTVIENYRIELV